MSFRKNFIWFFSLLGVALVAYFEGLTGPFIFDDLVFIGQNEWLTFSHIPSFLRSFIPISSISFNGFRPWVMTTLTLEHELFGVWPFIYKFDNLLIHTFNAFSLYFILNDLKKRVPALAKTPSFLPYVASLLFLLHPIQTNLLFLVWKRSTLLCLTGSLWSTWAFGRFAQETKNAYGYAILGCLAYLIAAGSKETALVLPGIILLSQLLIFKRSPRTWWKKILFIYLPVACLWTLHAWIVFVVQPQVLYAAQFRSQSHMPDYLMLSRGDYALTQVACFFHYVRLMVIPNDLNIFHDIRKVTDLASPDFLLGASLLIGALFLFVYFLRRQGAISFLMAWMILFLIPSSSFVPLNMILDEDRLSIPIVGYAVLLTYFLFYLRSLLGWSSKTLFSLFGIWLTLFTLLNFSRGYEWKNPSILWYRNAVRYPQDPRPWLNLASYWSSQGNDEKATALFEHILTLEPNYLTAVYFYGEHALFQKQYDKAERLFKKTWEGGYLPSDSALSLALVYELQNKPHLAEDYFKKSLRENPENVVALKSFNLFLDKRDRSKKESGANTTVEGKAKIID